MKKINLDRKIIYGALIIILLWFISLYIASVFFIKNDTSTLGTIGDSFGAINSLFSGLAFLGIIITILLQKEELRLQREELKMTRQELAKAAKAQEEQVKIQNNVAKLSAYAALLSKAKKPIIDEARFSYYEGEKKEQESFIKSEIEKILYELEIVGKK